MAFKKYNSSNNAIAALNLPISDTDTTMVLKGNYWRFSTSNFIVKVTTVVAWVVTARENIYVATRTGATCTGLVRAYEAVPVDDSASSNVQQALNFWANDIVEQVISAEMFKDMQDNLASQAGIQNQTYSYAADSGTANAYAITLAPVVTAYAAGQKFSFKALNSNTSVSTLNVNGLGTKTIKKTGGTADLASWDIVAGQIVEVVYDGTDFEMQTPVPPSIPVKSYVMGESCATWDAITLEKYTHPLACDSQISFWNAAATQRVAVRVMGNGLSMSSIFAGLKKVWAPVDNLVIAIQADTAGAPSWVDLVTATVAWGTLTTTTAQYNPSLSWSTTPTDKAWYWVEFRRSGANDVSNYYQIAVHTDDTVAYPYKIYNTSSYGSNTLTETHSVFGAGFYTEVAVRAKATIWKFARIFLYSPAALSALASISEAIDDTYAGLSSLQPGKGYYLSDTAGAVSLTPGTIKTSAGVAITWSKIRKYDSRTPLALNVSTTGWDVTATFYSNPYFVERAGIAELRANGNSGFNAGGTWYIQWSADLVSWNDYWPTSWSAGSTWTGSWVTTPIHWGMWHRSRITTSQSAWTTTAVLYT